MDAGARQLSAEGDRYLADLFRTTLRHLADAGHLAPAADVALEADRLHALFDGLCLQSTFQDTDLDALCIGDFLVEKLR